jgi:hypothetical protein
MTSTEDVTAIDLSTDENTARSLSEQERAVFAFLRRQWRKRALGCAARRMRTNRTVDHQLTGNQREASC